MNQHFVSVRAAEKLYGTVGKTDGDGEWKVDARRSEKLRAKKRKARLARAVRVEDWWRKERRRMRDGKMKGEAAQMYAECLSRSPDWAKEYREFWALPKDFSIPATPEERGPVEEMDD